MSEQDAQVVPNDPSDDKQQKAVTPASDDFLKQADDPYAQGDMPVALLEFHSPTAALVNMPPTPAAQYII